MSTRRAARHAVLINEALLHRWALPKLPEHTDKVARGDVLVVGGSAEIPGAVLLAGTAALRAGAGRVRIATAHTARAAMAVAFPEARVIGLPETRSGELASGGTRLLDAELGNADALVIGPGMREHAAAERLVKQLSKAQSKGVLILDAAALRVLRAPRATYARGVIATPHAGEMAELCNCERDQVLRDPLGAARETARAMNVVLVLKGAETFLVAPDGRAFRNVAGNVGLATAGSGDVLSGIIAALAARGAEPLQAAAWAVHLHARAGDALKRKHGALGYLAREIAAEVPRLLAKFSR
jgi:ADP-dependent NAD(P)H-hydrate dehydratase